MTNPNNLEFICGGCGQGVTLKTFAKNDLGQFVCPSCGHRHRLLLRSIED